MKRYWLIFKLWYQARQQFRARQWRPIPAPYLDRALRSGKAGEESIARACAILDARF
jgi:hypothetical protein